MRNILFISKRKVRWIERTHKKIKDKVELNTNTFTRTRNMTRLQKYSS